jgi:hypothetical protein
MPPAPEGEHLPEPWPAVGLPIRPPLPARVMGTALAVLGALAMTALLVDSLSHSQWRTAVVSTLFWAVWVTGVLRTARRSVEVDADGRLVVRNTGRTRRFRPEEVADVRPPTGRWSALAGAGALELVLTDGSTLLMQATGSPLRRRGTAAVRRTAILAAVQQGR